jgi:drug/metabolite transporter (DMT)-like permease
MAVALVLLPGMDAIAKLLSQHLPVMEIVWARFLFFAAIARMPLGDAMAVLFVYPLLIFAASARWMGERITAAQWLWLAVGFLGVLLAAGPHLHGLSTGLLFALGSAVAYASALMLTRIVAKADASYVTATISALGGLAAVGHTLIIHAHRMASAAVLAPCGYMEIVAALIYGRIMFGDVPRWPVIAGAVLIIGGGFATSWPKRAQRTPQAQAASNAQAARS